jgi:hypothetical protein
MSFEPRHGEARQAGTSISSQVTSATGSRFGSQPTGPPERYGKHRNAYLGLN